MALEKMIEVLGQVEFFKNFSKDQINLVAFVSDFRQIPAGDLLVKQGDVAEGAFILVSGELVTEHEGGKHPDSVIDQPGALIGDMALLAATPRAVSIRARTNCDVVFVPRTHFKKLIQTYPELGEMMAAHIRQSLSSYVDALSSVGAKLKRG
ncbi:cyclic nucleotide-binding domain-containing protein [Maritalea mediterranea]|uniref:Cyclic nucleotide-binding domain-containing protein n=1 Tax=Maritalea mediterranea TaxID=2909667 RepID=A0ABS9E214_9HYPH|nr:cyclic nucleotide-binding domain-containing protein [Maritalea mediterranea]MCF4096906.1 cyclic nucleotide-binding domain-containing protein [Maritalea mediterranea]